jgi:hypothetical protein
MRGNLLAAKNFNNVFGAPQKVCGTFFGAKRLRCIFLAAEKCAGRACCLVWARLKQR